MLQAVENHRRLEEIVREMREITQTLILESLPEVRRRRNISSLGKAAAPGRKGRTTHYACLKPGASSHTECIESHVRSGYGAPAAAHPWT